MPAELDPANSIPARIEPQIDRHLGVRREIREALEQMPHGPLSTFRIELPGCALNRLNELPTPARRSLDIPPPEKGTAPGSQLQNSLRL